MTRRPQNFKSRRRLSPTNKSCAYLAGPRRNLGATRWHLVTALLSRAAQVGLRGDSRVSKHLFPAPVLLCFACWVRTQSPHSHPLPSTPLNLPLPLNPRPTSNTLTTKSNPPVAISPALLSSHAHLFRLLANKLSPFPLLGLALAIGTSVSKFRSKTSNSPAPVTQANTEGLCGAHLAS